jgi:hypothetical protein
LTGVDVAHPRLYRLLGSQFITFSLYRNFDEVARLVVERAQQIPLQHRLLFWHHCLKEAYGYMIFQRL